MSADLQFKQLIDRILRCREAEDEAKQDTKEIYAELKSRGYDKTAAGALVSEIRKKDKNPDQFEERNAVLGTYREAYRRASHAHAREASGSSNGRAPEFDSGNGGSNPSLETIEPDHTSKSTAARNGAGKTGVTAGETATSFIAEPGVAAEATGNDLREPVAAEQGQIIREGDAPRETDYQAGEASQGGSDASCPDTEFQSEQPCTATGPSEEAGASSDETPATHSSVESRERQTTIAVSKPEATPKDRSLPSAGPSGTAAQIFPSDLVSEPAVAKPQDPQPATADQFSRAPVETDPLHEQADVKMAGTNPRETRAGASGEGQRRPPNQVEPGPHSLSPSSEACSSPLTKTAGDVLPPLASPATQFNNPRCRKPDSCHYAHSRDCCHDCLLAWGLKPRDEQRRLWQAAERAACQCEVAA